MSLPRIRNSMFVRRMRTNGFGRSKYRVGKFTIVLPRGHQLPRYQHEFPTYDRFLPFLARYLPSGSSVLDIGANVGDTLAGIASANGALKLIGVEPDKEFFPLLRDNVSEMKKQVPTLDVTLVRALVSHGLNVKGLTGTRGTRHAVLSDGAGVAGNEGYELLTMDALVAKYVSASSLSLVKSDTDGFRLVSAQERPIRSDYKGSALIFRV